MLPEVTPFNAGKKIPTAKELRSYMHRAGAAQKELESQIAVLEKEVDSSKASVLERLVLEKKIQELDALQHMVDPL